MPQLIIAFIIATSLVGVGCSLPGKPALRVAITRSAGSSVLYIAQEAGLFAMYGVNVQLVELNSACECGMALMDGHVDAAIMPHIDLGEIEKAGAEPGVIMLVSASSDSQTCVRHQAIQGHWAAGPAEVLAGDRTALMQRRHDWEQVLLAYEHARLLLAGEPEIQADRIAGRENREITSVINDLSRWTIFSVADQDSLFRNEGTDAALHAHWQGRRFLTSSVTTSLEQVSNRDLKWYGVTSK